RVDLIHRGDPWADTVGEVLTVLGSHPNWTFQRLHVSKAPVVKDCDPKDVVHGFIWRQVATRFAHDVSNLQFVVEFLGNIWIRNDLVMAKHSGRRALKVAGALVYGANRLGFRNILEIIFNVRSKGQAVSNHRWI